MPQLCQLPSCFDLAGSSAAGVRASSAALVREPSQVARIPGAGELAREQRSALQHAWDILDCHSAAPHALAYQSEGSSVCFGR